MSQYGPDTGIIELFHRGDHLRSIEWYFTVPFAWVKVSHTSGVLSRSQPEQRLEVSIDQDAVRDTFFRNRPASGFSESGGIIAIEGPHFQRSSSGDVSFKHKHFGTRSESGSIALRPCNTARESEDEAKAAWVE
ncbi:hypothetical protein B0J13DRAFT_680902 [Dactylonectria estremocensis]|uniref:Uncharacterized protein n=1 Tax=Dactylonectria estremocensis TaxID=1079267 RepID=A0A9P9DGH6_9HYPO|nr:hypothetical protein B0J13DRAFT_680902 [Dactylonectria estremocensis]